MPLREDLLKPIPGSNPSGEDLRAKPVSEYDEIKEARREEDDLAQGVWQHERKVADYLKVAKLAQEALATKSKDLQLAAWLTEALLKTNHFAGLCDGLNLFQGLMDRFWDTLYPVLDDGDAEPRAAPLEWVGTRLDLAVRNVPLNKAGNDWFKYTESRKVGYEDQAKTDAEKKARKKMLDEGKLAPELFDKSFAETPKVFYLQSEKDLDACLEALKKLDKTCAEKFGDVAPTFGPLRKALEEVRHTVHGLLEEKRKTEPDPVLEEPKPVSAAGSEGVAAGAAPGNAEATASASILISVQTSSEPADRRDVIASIANAAAFLRKRDPYSPAPYLMMRGLRWGELRRAAKLSDPTMLEAPPTELRQHIKKLALNQQWKELLEAAENAMALPCSRAWLDLQRFVIEACVGLGGDYETIARAIRSELKALLRDLPELLGATLMDDTPAANQETQAWLRELMAEPALEASPETVAAAPLTATNDDGPTPGWRKKFVDSYTLAVEALRSGQQDKAFEILTQEIARQNSGRERFLRRMQLVQLCISAGKDNIAQPLLDDLSAAIEAHKLEDWEDREMVAGALAMIMKSSKKVQADAKEKQKLFDRICRLDPVQALTSG
jgi:type VI secretion system protein ImpA